MKLFLFNPENDIALASGLRRITPPRQAVLLHQAGAMLPFWLGGEDDVVLVPSDQLESAQAWHRTMRSAGIRGPQPVADCHNLPYGCQPTPWGWSHDAKEQFVKAGFGDECFLPSTEALDRHRLLSSRAMQIPMLEELERNGIERGGYSPIVATDYGKVQRYVEQFGSSFLKSPWSSSGRGVFPVGIDSLAKSEERIRGIIRNQGAIMVEPQLNKVVDFALLYTITPAEISYLGISVFHNSTATNYGGNVVACQSELNGIITEYISPNQLETTIKATAISLKKVYGDDYFGPVGVDMMVYKTDEGGYAICPCVEINLRYTMGFVALGLMEKLHKPGMMRIRPRLSAKGGDEASSPLVPDNPYFDIVFTDR